MMNMMQIFLTDRPADARWGDQARLSGGDHGLTIHHSGCEPLHAIQCAARKVDGMGIKTVTLAGSGWGLEQSWAFWQGFRSPTGGQHVEWARLPDAQFTELTRRLKIIDWVRDTINTPAEELGPEQLATRAADLIIDLGGGMVSYQMVTGDELRTQNYVGLYQVGRGSERPPVLLTLDYNPSGRPDAPVHACLVGKGITFDSGGYSLKPSALMDSMKSDMGGAATVSGALALAVARGLS